MAKAKTAAESTAGTTAADDSVDPTRVVGIKYLKRVFRLLGRLRGDGRGRDRAGNRRLHFPQYAGLMLLAMFNPTLQSLRGLSRVSALKKVQKRLGGGRASVGSLSESCRVFDPDLLLPIIDELRSKLPDAPNGKTRHIPEQLARGLTAVDGSALRALPQIVAAVGGDAKWRLHLQFDVWRGLPEQAVVAPDETGGDDDERAVLARHLQPGKTYVADRGYERYALFERIVQAGSDYVIRAQERPVEIVESRPISAEARAAGVVRDEIVRLGRSRGDVGAITHPVRRVVIHGGVPQRPGAVGHERRTEVVLLTNLVDVPAETLAAIYRLRWQIELFFRFFKHVLGCRTLLSTRDEGVAIQVYVAIIAALLPALAVGRDIGRVGHELICLYLQGWADEDELLAGLERLTASKKPK